MKSEKMLKAIGSVSDELIEDANLEKLHTVETRKYLYPRKIFRFGLAAVLVAGLLGVTALAVELFRYEPQISDPVEVVTPTRDGVSQSGTMHSISFRLPLNEDAPELIERYYFPELPAEYEQSFGMAYAGLKRDRLGALHFRWAVPGGTSCGLEFRQENKPENGEIHMNLSEPTLKESTLGGVEGMLIVETDVSWKTTYQYFYWSDGNYVFSMYFPLDFTEEQMGEMIASVREVEDIRPYLISMEEKDIEETFG